MSIPSTDATFAYVVVDVHRRCERPNEELFLPPSNGGGKVGAPNADVGEAFSSDLGVRGALSNNDTPSHRLMVLIGERCNDWWIASLTADIKVSSFRDDDDGGGGGENDDDDMMQTFLLLIVEGKAEFGL